MEKWQ
jgi:hypothetical protein